MCIRDRTYRVHEWATLDPADHEEVLTRAVWAAEALSRTVGTDGRIAYLWDVSEGKEKRGSNLLRHAGSTYSLIQAWERTGHPPWREAADRALTYLLSKSRSDERFGPYGGGIGRYLVEGSHIKLGGAGLALVALSSWQSATGDRGREVEAREALVIGKDLFWAGLPKGDVTLQRYEGGHGWKGDVFATIRTGMQWLTSEGKK